MYLTTSEKPYLFSLEIDSAFKNKLSHAIAEIRDEHRHESVDLKVNLSSSSVGLDGDQLRQIATQISLLKANLSQRCVFIANPGAEYGIARMLSAHLQMQGFETAVVQCDHEASDWLSKPKAPVDRTYQTNNFSRRFIA